MAVTAEEIDAAIKRALLNGETWEMGDIKSHISLERLMQLKQEVAANNDGIQFHLASFQVVRSDGA